MASQTDLDQHIANSEPAALRVGDAMRLLPLVLLRYDDCVQRAYTDWQARIVRYEDVGEFTEAAALQSLFDDSVQLNGLVRELKLQRYQRWLPTMLRAEFQRALEGAPRVEVTVPAGLDWAKPGKRPGAARARRADCRGMSTWSGSLLDVRTPRGEKAARDYERCKRHGSQRSSTARLLVRISTRAPPPNGPRNFSTPNAPAGRTATLCPYQVPAQHGAGRSRATSRRVDHRRTSRASRRAKGPRPLALRAAVLVSTANQARLSGGPDRGRRG